MAGHVVRTGERRGAYIVLVEKSEGKRPARGLRRRLEDNIKMDLREVGMVSHGMDLCGSGSGQVWGFGECGNERSGSINFGEFLDLLKTF
jgi:hypothetical protein